MKDRPTGRFFEKGAKAAGGHFFRDYPGRSDGSFHEKTAIYSYAPGQIPNGGGAVVGPSFGTGKGKGKSKAKSKYGTGDGEPDGAGDDLKINAPPEAGEEAGGGMYGTGGGRNVPLRSLLNIVGPGRTRPAVKVSSAAPSDWEDGEGIPTGFHRPAEKQPEPLEAGGDRFFATDAKPAAYGAGPETRHGLVEGGSMRMRSTSGPQMGKHASADPQRFLGTSFAKTALSTEDASDWASQRGSEFGSSLRRFGDTVASKGGEAVKSITQSPGASAVAALVAAKLGVGALRRGGRGVGRLIGRRPKAAPSIAGHALGGLRKLITGR